MGLRLTLKPYERVIVNGCILRNGARRQVLDVENRADILRGDDMLTAETAQTPVRRIAYQLQIALVSQHHRAEYMDLILSGLSDLKSALPRFADQIADAADLATEGNHYAAYRALVPVIAHEDLLFAHIEKASQ